MLWMLAPPASQSLELGGQLFVLRDLFDHDFHRLWRRVRADIESRQVTVILGDMPQQANQVRAECRDPPRAAVAARDPFLPAAPGGTGSQFFGARGLDRKGWLPGSGGPEWG